MSRIIVYFDRDLNIFQVPSARHMEPCRISASHIVMESERKNNSDGGRIDVSLNHPFYLKSAERLDTVSTFVLCVDGR